ncbi:hypothetical protein L3X38_008242 [Prunus dulcis]|uniref:Uncharacterized protein n=1 Tax=Prunus dulcis TaxID=3755 RepID=A0AAD4ZW74_PRUDU|nr:hypothetical protein L3X38_008242 [Prunus dulcis]
MRKSGLTRGSPNLVILCLRKVVSLRKIKFLQKERSVRPWGYRCGTGRRLSDAQGSLYIGLRRRALCSYFRCGTVEAGREHDTCPRSKVSCLGFGRIIAEGPAVSNVDFVHASGGHWSFIYGINIIQLSSTSAP